MVAVHAGISSHYSVVVATMLVVMVERSSSILVESYPL